MKIKRFLIALISIIYVAFLALCSLSHGSGAAGISTPAILGPRTISFTAGSFPEDTEELSLVLEAGESAKLDGFTALRSLDLSGSTCYEEIAAWAAAHPKVTVKYTVSMPGGAVLDNTAEAADLSGLSAGELEEAAELLAYLPALKSVDLGSPDGSVSPRWVAALDASLPEAELSCRFTLCGQSADYHAERLDLTGLTSADAEAAAELISVMPELTYVDLGGHTQSFGWQDIGLLQQAREDVDISYGFTLFGKELNILDEALDFNHITMSDEGAAVREILPYMTRCTYLDMDFCGVSNGAMEGIRNDFPSVKVVWRIWFGTNYSVRTDVIKILASKPSKGGQLNNAECAVLKYCSDLKYLDLGHNEAISDISFVYGMPELEVLVIAMNPLSDITPLASCPHLEYLELNSTSVSDLSPLSGLTELRHLNIGNCPNVSDISPLYGLTELERLWIGCVDPVPAEQVAIMQENAPDCRIDTTTLDPTQGNWRYADLNDKGWITWEKYGYFDFDLDPRYELLQQQFGYLDGAYSFTWLDPKYDAAG